MSNPSINPHEGADPSLINSALDRNPSLQEEIDKARKDYGEYRESNDEAVKIGLYGEDLENALHNPDTIFLSHKTKDSGLVKVPLLIPAEGLEWYNIELLKDTYGQEQTLYYYAHPPVSSDPEERAELANLLKESLDKGAVIFMDQYKRPDGGTAESLCNLIGNEYDVDTLGGDETRQSASIVFAGPVNFSGVESVHEAPSIVDAYKQAVKDGEVVDNKNDGAALAEIIEGEEAEKIWEIYDRPFQELGHDHPSTAGFDKQGLMGILADPGVAKLVNRVNGQITTLCIFSQDFDLYPWFNKKYYADNFADYFNTGNVLIFPGIVSDDRMRGASYSSKLVALATQLYAKRGSNVLVTFECTEISATYIPKIVSRAINHSGFGTVTEIEHPISTTEYKAIRKSD